MVGKTKNTLAKLPATKIVEALFDEAVKEGANFIHIEPTIDKVMVRLRVNGVLKNVQEIPKKRFISVVERLKGLANLEVKERRIPQDGRFKSSINDRLYAFAISIIPTINGEKIAINIQDTSAEIPQLTDLGLWGHSLRVLEDAVNRKSGLIMVSGPTDSGKSTTIYSLLGNIKDTELNIATIEDPVEFKLPNANQTQVNDKANLSFSNGLKALVKHDTNVIMVSELRDEETTKHVLDIAIRGRLVISSLYVESAAIAVEQIRNMSPNPGIIAHGLKLITSQRLVRRLCPDCKESYAPDRLVLIQTEELFGVNNPARKRMLHKLETELATSLMPAKVKLNSKDLSSTDTTIKRLWRPHPGGCLSCSQSGFKGRVGIFESMVISPAIEKLIVGYGSNKVINDQAVKEGMITIQVDGLVKSLVGITSLEEVVRFGLDETT